jgi:hypothetical protein
MDNAEHAWELPEAMWTATFLALAWALPDLLAPGALAGEARRGPDGASAELAADPPRRQAARAMLERAAAANDDREAVAEALYRLGDMDEDDGAFMQAVAHDRACVAIAPDTRWAVRASERIDWLSARSEAAFAPLERLERVRRNPALASDSTAIDALARDAESFPPGTVRVEARMLVAEAWLGRMRRPSDAIRELRKVAGDPQADPITASLAEREIVETIAAGGEIVEAAAEAHARGQLLDPRFVRRVDRLVRRRWVRRAATGVILTFATLTAVALVRARRRRALDDAARAMGGLAAVAVAFVAFVAVAGGTLASRYESGNAWPFLLLGLAVLPLVLLARAWSAVGSTRPASQIARALLCATTVLAAAFVLLDVVSPEYLEGFNL